MEKNDIKSYTIEELKEQVIAMGEKPFRATQLYEWMHKKLARSFDEMTNLSKEFRKCCAEQFAYTCLEPIAQQTSKIDGTRKFLFELADGNVVESVWMQYKHGNSVCISSQVGCRMGCRFCASTLDGLTRSLTASEMLDQIYAITRLTGERVSNVVVMGIGEPLDNYDNLLRFIRLLTDENGLHISQRSVTVSTCGLADKITALAKEKLQITLALSLHAATDEQRKGLMPVAKRYSIEELMEACLFYAQEAGRRVTFEYSLIKGVNDSERDAENLTGLARRVGAHINLIPVNPIRERAYQAPDAGYVRSFLAHLENAKVPASVRRTLGSDIDGACGQLRKRHSEDEKKQG